MNICYLKCVNFVLLSKASKGRLLEGCHLNLKLLLLLLLENCTATIKHKESFGVCVCMHATICISL